MRGLGSVAPVRVSTFQRPMWDSTMAHSARSWEALSRQEGGMVAAVFSMSCAARVGWSNAVYFSVSFFLQQS